MDSAHRLVRGVSGRMFSKYSCVLFTGDVSDLCRTLPEAGEIWVPTPRGSRDVLLSSTVCKENNPYFATQDLSRVLEVSLSSDGRVAGTPRLRWGTPCFTAVVLLPGNSASPSKRRHSRHIPREGHPASCPTSAAWNCQGFVIKSKTSVRRCHSQEWP